MLLDKYIAFVGDSFCASYEVTARTLPNLFADGFDDWRHRPRTHQRFDDCGPCWTTELAKILGLRIMPFGFGGMNWWHSRWYFFQYYQGLSLQQQRDIEVIVFCHTGYDRPLCRDNQGTRRANLTQHEKNGWNFYYDNIWDDEFAHWARAQYFAEISTMFGHTQTVHLPCFDHRPEEVTGWNKLPGMRFDSPLFWLALSEFEGSMQHIDLKMKNEGNRPNHLGEHNNRALAQQLAEKIQSGCVGRTAFDFSRFNVVNPNYHEWPHGDFGSQR